MRVGIMVTLSGSRALDEVLEIARAAADSGLASVWLSNVFGLDALTTIAAIGREVPRIELGTAVVPTYPRHPMALAQQALTTQLAAGGRLVLGIGPSHRVTVEGAWGYSFDRPLRHVREYLDVLEPLLRGQPVDADGETVHAHGQLNLPGAAEVPLLLAALGPRMLRLAGARTQGTITWLVGPRTLREHVAPRLAAAAAAAGRPAPRVVVGLPVGVTSDVPGLRERINQSLGRYGTLPSYRAMLDLEGAEAPGDVAVLGDEAAVRDQLGALAEAGATDFMASPVGSRDERQRTQALLASLAARP
jgi:5,10-methylenetetrahydromethanopterin reductase